MHGVARKFFILAIIYSLFGMALGLQMSITHDHGQMPTHAHTMVAGWLMSAVFAFFYHLVPAASSSRLAEPHFWLTAISGSVLMIGLYLVLGGNEGFAPVLAATSIAFYAGMVLFAFIALKAMRRPVIRLSELYPDGTVVQNR